MKVDRNPTKPISRGKSKTQKTSPTHKTVAPKPLEKKTEPKLTEKGSPTTEENYRSIFEQAPVGIFQSTPQGRFRNVNSAMAQIYGYDSPEQMITEITSIGDQVYVNSSARQEFQRILAERGEIHNSLDENYRKDGSRIWTQTTARAIKDKDGNVLFYEGFIIDVTERLREQLQLHESEECFRALIENASDMILTITADGNLNYVSPAALRITGYQADEVIGRNIVEFIHADDLPLALQALASRSKISGLAPDPIELRFQHKDGMWRIVEILGNNLLENPAVKGIVLNVRDITERKQAEAAVHESEDRYRDLVENSQDLICTHDLNGQILSTNPRAEKMLGYEHTALLQMNFRDILAPEALPGLTAYLRRITKRGADQGQMIVQTKTGERRIWEYNNTLRTEGVSTPIVRGMARDITERKRAEDELRAISTRQEAILAAVPDILMEVDKDKVYTWANPAGVEFFGEDVIGKEAAFYFEGDQDTYGAVKPLFNGSKDVIYVESWQRRKDGEKRLLAWWCRVLKDTDGNVTGALSSAHDITERKRAEEALRENEKTFRSLFENMLNGFAYCQMLFEQERPSDFIYLEVNKAFEKQTGLKNVVGKKVSEVIPGIRESDPELFATYGRVALTGIAETFETYVEALRMWFSISVYSPKKEYFVAVFDVITERKQAEQALRESEALYHTLFDDTPIGIGIADRAGNLHLFNEAILQLGGYTRDDISRIGNVANLYYAGEQRDEVLALARQQGFVRQHPVQFIRKDGTFYDALLSMVPVQIKGEPGWQAIVEDITARKRAEEEIVRRAEEFSALYETSRDLVSVQNLAVLLTTIVDRATKLLSAPRGLCYLYDAATDELELVVEHGSLLPPGARLKMGEGMGGRVALTREPMIVDNYSTWEDHAAQYKGLQIAAALEVPMLYRGELIGVLGVTEVGTKTRQFFDADAHLLSLFASSAAGAVHNARLHEETMRQLDQLEALHSIDVAISASMDLRVTLNILLKHVTTQLKMDAADVLLFNPHSQMLEYAAGDGFRGRAVERTRFRIGEGQAGLAALEQRMIQHPDFAASGIVFAQAELLAAENVAAYFAVPLIAKGKVKGVLEVFHRAIFHPELDWISFLETLAGQAAIAIDSAQLFENLQTSKEDLEHAYEATIEGWSRALDLRDKETEGHSRRVTETTLQLAKAMGIGDEKLVHVRRGALLHDIGKMGVPDSILLKSGKLTDEEWVLVRKHPALAYELLSPIAYLREALDIPYCHHEKWDGTGYPRGLKGEQIPLTARIFTVVDVWDALISERLYRAAWTPDQVREHILSLAGTHFDPNVVPIFLELMGKTLRDAQQK